MCRIFQYHIVLAVKWAKNSTTRFGRHMQSDAKKRSYERFLQKIVEDDNFLWSQDRNKFFYKSGQLKIEWN